MKRVSLLFAALLVAGCGSTSPPTVPTTDAPVSEVAQPPARTQVTLYVAGMNQRLKILGGDGPNTVKQALAELDAVELVEDEWERNLESEEDLDLLFVSYDANRVTIEQLLEKIKTLGFEATVKE